MKVFGKGFNFSQDGPGNRLVYHLSGCNMKCVWCSNPEGMDTNAGQEYDEEQVINECISCKPMFFSGGGVTFTGGESTLQFVSLEFILKRLKENNIHTCIETNATSKKLMDLSPLIDYLIMDFKHYDSDVLREFTGVDNKEIKLNFERLCKTRKQLHVRIPIINGFNADNPSGFVEYFKKNACANVVFEFLPYHEYGKEKWKTEYRVKNGFITPDVLEKFINTFKENGLNIVNT